MDILELEMRRCFQFFMDYTNLDEASPGFGLVSDNSMKPIMASIAAVGFSLSGLVVGATRGWIDKDQVRLILKGTLETFYYRVDHYHGLFVHFVDLYTAKRYHNSEYSTIDSVLFLNGAITACAYVNDPECNILLEKLLDRIDWEEYMFMYQGRRTFRMAYNPTRGGAYRGDQASPWIYHWHMTAEQLTMYVLCAADQKITPETARELYDGFERRIGRYHDLEYHYSPSNGLFVYQYSHAWIDFLTYHAKDIDWFENSKRATLGNYAWCLDHQHEFSSLGQYRFGLTACLTRNGYRPQGVQPTDLPNGEHECFNVIPPSGIAGSAPFTPDLVKESLEYLQKEVPDSFREYGFTDGIEWLDDQHQWISPHYIAINKGITLLMIDNARYQTTWKYYHQHPRIQKAMEVLSFSKEESKWPQSKK